MTVRHLSFSFFPSRGFSLFGFRVLDIQNRIYILFFVILFRNKKTSQILQKLYSVTNLVFFIYFRYAILFVTPTDLPVSVIRGYIFDITVAVYLYWLFTDSYCCIIIYVYGFIIFIIMITPYHHLYHHDHSLSSSLSSLSLFIIIITVHNAAMKLASLLSSHSGWVYHAFLWFLVISVAFLFITHFANFININHRHQQCHSPFSSSFIKKKKKRTI